MKTGRIMLGLALVAVLGRAQAGPVGTVVLIDDALETLPVGYTLSEFTSANATASMQIGDVGGSNGLIFDGTWNVPAGGQEFAVGSMAPVIATPGDFQLDPAAVDGVAAVRWMLDAAVISSTMVPPEQGIFAQLVVFQQQPDGSVLAFADAGNFIPAGGSETLDRVLVESEFGLPGQHPDFRAVGRPLSFGLQFGASYPRTTQPGAFFVDGRMTGDNWQVEILGGAGIFNDGFEAVEPIVTVRSAPDDGRMAAPPLAAH